MVRGLYSSYTGMVAQQQKLDIISNNLANVDTTGYKKDGAIFESFKDAFTLKIKDPEKPGYTRIGTLNQGVSLERIFTHHTQGALKQTDDFLNIAIQGEGFIKVNKIDSNGKETEYYTRDGSFSLDAEGNLLTKDGYFVMGENGIITLENSDIQIDSQGNIYSNNQLVDKIALVNVENKDSLRKVGSNLYKTTQETQITDFNGSIAQGFLEASNVDTVREMVEMINVMRGYESNQKVLTSYDTLLDKSVNSIGRL